MLNKEIREYIDRSVLCWLATASSKNVPNVSPKEVFSAYEDDSIIIANIASPQSVKNIQENENICLSFIDVFVQKGFQLKGHAKIITEKDLDYNTMKNQLEDMTNGKFPFASIIRFYIKEVKKIVAPSYILYPEIPIEKRVADTKKTYSV